MVHAMRGDFLSQLFLPNNLIDIWASVSFESLWVGGTLSKILRHFYAIINCAFLSRVTMFCISNFPLSLIAVPGVEPPL